MNQELVTIDVLTLEEAADYLRLDIPRLEAMAEKRELPCRKAGNEWRFLKSALQEWLRGIDNPQQALARQAGVLKDDPVLLKLVNDIQKRRKQARR